MVAFEILPWLCILQKSVGQHNSAIGRIAAFQDGNRILHIDFTKLNFSVFKNIWCSGSGFRHPLYFACISGKKHF